MKGARKVTPAHVADAFGVLERLGWEVIRCTVGPKIARELLREKLLDPKTRTLWGVRCVVQMRRPNHLILVESEEHVVEVEVLPGGSITVYAPNSTITMIEASHLKARFGEKIRVFREERGLTQTALAALAGLKRMAIHHYEKGKHGKALVDLVRIAKALGVQPQALLPDEKVRL